MSGQHSPVLIAATIAAPVVFICTAAFNALAAQPNTGIFQQSTGGISDKYYTEITPAGWAFSIWGIIYFQQAAWLIYALTLLCRKGLEGPLYVNPVLLSTPFFIIYCVNLLLNLAWLILFDRELLELAFVFLVGIAVTLYVCIGLSYKALHENRTILAKQGRKLDEILIRVLVHNGLGTYAAWTTIASLLNMAFVVAYRSNPVIDQSVASTISLGFITVVLIVFVATDFTILDRFSRYTVTPYAVVIWALSASLSKNFDSSNRNSIFTIVIIALGAVALVAKIVLIIVRRKTKPVFSYNVTVLDEKSKIVGTA